MVSHKANEVSTHLNISLCRSFRLSFPACICERFILVLLFAVIFIPGSEQAEHFVLCFQERSVCVRGLAFLSYIVIGKKPLLCNCSSQGTV